MQKKSAAGFLSYLLIVFGAGLASFSVACILLPNDAIDYGTAGIAILISKLAGFNLSLCVLLIFLPFLVAGTVFLGKSFCIKALLGSAVYMVGLEYFAHLNFVLNTEHFIAVIFGGAILGAGLALILRAGGCIDGSEILANIIVSKLSEKTGKNIGMSGILVVFNACVYFAVFLMLNRDSAMMSLLVYIVATSIIDRFTDHFEAIKQVTIITQKPEAMIAQIREDMNKTCTIMDSYGAIAGKNKTLICYVTYFELQKLNEIIDNFDGNAFVTVSSIDKIINKTIRKA